MKMCARAPAIWPLDGPPTSSVFSAVASLAHSELHVQTDLDQASALDAAEVPKARTQLCDTGRDGRLVGRVEDIETWRKACGLPEAKRPAKTEVESGHVRQPRVPHRPDAQRLVPLRQRNGLVGHDDRGLFRRPGL